MKKSQGFTLIELMVVIVIIGILAAIAIPKFMDASTKAKCGEIPVVIGSYDHAQLAYLAEAGSLAGAETDLIMDAPKSNWFSYTYGGAGLYTASITKPLGKVNTASTATSTVTTSGGVTHAVSDDLGKYLPNFKTN
jgi:prepilin-type N-terminal cleavage/methylation domain-containing protein